MQDGMGTVPWVRGSFGQRCPSPGTSFPSTHGPALPITGPTHSSSASAKVGNGVWRGCGGPAALQHLITPYLGKTGRPRTSLPGSRPCLAPGAWASHFRRVGRGARQGEAWRRRWGFAQGQEEMVISLWSTEEARAGRQGVLQEVGSVCSESGDEEWALGCHAGRAGGGCLGGVCMVNHLSLRALGWVPPPVRVIGG